MKKRIALIVLMFVLSAVPTAFAAESPEMAARDYYAACATGDVDAIIKTVDMAYVQAHLADEETYRLYLETAYGAARVTGLTASNMVFAATPDNGGALGSVDVRTQAVLAEDGTEAAWEDTFMVYATNTGGDWKVAFTMHKDLYETKVQEAATLQYLLLAQDIAEEEAARSEALYDEAGNPLVDPSEVDMEGAVVLPGETAGQSGEEADASSGEDADTASKERMEAAIAAHEAHEKGKGLLTVALVLALMAGGGAFFLLKRKRK